MNNAAATAATAARVDMLVAAICAIASTLPPDAAHAAAEALREHAAGLAVKPLQPDADEALRADLALLLAALARKAPPLDRDPRRLGRALRRFRHVRAREGVDVIVGDSPTIDIAVRARDASTGRACRTRHTVRVTLRVTRGAGATLT